MTSVAPKPRGRKVIGFCFAMIRDFKTGANFKSVVLFAAGDQLSSKTLDHIRLVHIRLDGTLLIPN